MLSGLSSSTAAVVIVEESGGRDSDKSRDDDDIIDLDRHTDGKTGSNGGLLTKRCVCLCVFECVYTFVTVYIFMKVCVHIHDLTGILMARQSRMEGC